MTGEELGFYNIMQPEIRHNVALECWEEHYMHTYNAPCYLGL